MKSAKSDIPMETNLVWKKRNPQRKETMMVTPAQMDTANDTP